MAELGRDLIFAQRKRERDSNCCHFHLVSRQSGNAIANLALGYGLKVVEVRSAGVGKSVFFGQHHFGRDASDRRCDRRNGDRVQDRDCRVAGENEHRALLVGRPERVPADVTSVHWAPQSCSFNQTLNSPGATGWRT